MLKGKFKVTWWSRLAKSSKITIAVPIVLFLVVLSSGFIFSSIIYKEKVLPNTRIAGVEVEGVAFEDVFERVENKLSSAKITLTLGDNEQEFTGSEVQLSIQNKQQLLKSMQSRSLSKSFFPYLQDANYEIELGIDLQELQSYLEVFKKEDFTQPQNAEFTIDDANEIQITSGEAGYGIDNAKIAEQIKMKFKSGIADTLIELNPTEIDPSITTEDIENKKGQIALILGQKYSVEGVSVSISDVASWLQIVRENNQVQLTVNKGQIEKFVNEVADSKNSEPVNEITTTYLSGKTAAITTKGEPGQTVKNKNEVIEELFLGVQKSQGVTAQFEYEEVPFEKQTVEVDDRVAQKQYTYSVAVWGSVKSDFNTFKSRAAETLNDSRGWKAGGNNFSQVASGGNFTLVLASPPQVEAAAPICSALYSCRVGRNVIINDERWRTATDSWNNAGGNLRDYQHMVINHEVGHWLGNGHANCPAAGSPAPVMQQQSINLQGCRFNPWPLSSEL